MTSMKADKKNKILSKVDSDIGDILDEIVSRVESGDLYYGFKLLERMDKLEKIKNKIESIQVE